jgi:hypothetical protein
VPIAESPAGSPGLEQSSAVSNGVRAVHRRSEPLQTVVTATRRARRHSHFSAVQTIGSAVLNL